MRAPSLPLLSSAHLSSQADLGDKPQLSLLAPAKINLFLHITGKRADGYHDLQTLFRLVNWGDTLHFCPIDNDSGDMTCDDVARRETNRPLLASDLIELIGAEHITDHAADNLIIKAAQALIDTLLDSGAFKHQAVTAPPSALTQVRISVDKVIPMGAGLGGGSSNAATTLMALNELWRLGLTQQQLIEIGAKVGADVPIFIFGQDAIGEGIGERLTALKLPTQRYLLLFPKAHISTAQLFSHPSLQRNCPYLTQAQIAGDTSSYLWGLQPPYHNVFEPVVSQLSFEVAEALEALHQLAHTLTDTYQLSSSLSARLTGSGSTVFLPLPPEASDSLIEAWLKQSGFDGQIVQTLSA